MCHSPALKPKVQGTDLLGLITACDLNHKLAILRHNEHSSVMKAQYDYDAAAQAELSLKDDDQTLLVFGDEDGWLLVQEDGGGKVGYVPGIYVE